MTSPTRLHLVNRTSPKGEPFIGTCSLCGQSMSLREATTTECPNQRGLTQDDALIEAISGRKP